MSLLDALVGTWVGQGRGHYPTIEPFSYAERVTFTRSPKGFIVYQQTTSHPETGLPMHAEAGYLRSPGGDADVELVVVQPTGVTETHVGRVQVVGSSVRLVFRSTHIGLTPTAKSVTDVRRELDVDGDVLDYRLFMAAVGQPLQHHLSATLARIMT